MSRRKTFPSLSSSRQMMMAWKVSGLSHRPAIMASRPASMRLAMAISPSRESSSTEPISRRYMRTGSSVRSVGSLASALAGTFCWTSTSSPPSASGSSSAPRAALLLCLGLLGLDHVDAHLAEHRQNVLDLLGIDLLGGQHRVDLVVGDVAALLGVADELLDGGVRQVEQRQRRIRGLGRLLSRRLFLLLFVFLDRLGLARHTSLLDAARPRASLKTTSLPYAGGMQKVQLRFSDPSQPAYGIRLGESDHLLHMQLRMQCLQDLFAPGEEGITR